MQTNKQRNQTKQIQFPQRILSSNLLAVYIAGIFSIEIYSYWVTLFGLYYHGTNDIAERTGQHQSLCLSFHFRREKGPRLNDGIIHFKW